MKIGFNNNCLVSNGSNKANFRFPKLAPLSRDTVSFGAMKKSQFMKESGIDLAVVNRFQAPIEKFNSTEDFQKWCKTRVDLIEKTDFQGRTKEVQEARKNALQEWYKDIEPYSNSKKLLVLDSLIKGLKEDNDAMPLPCVSDKSVLKETLVAIEDECQKNPKYQANFGKTYKEKLVERYLSEYKDVLSGEKDGWIMIDGKEKDPANYEDNLNRVKLISAKSWCTKNEKTEICLQNGDFHVYYKNGKPALAMTYDKDGEIGEIQGVLNNFIIPVEYINVVHNHFIDDVKEHKFSEMVLMQITKAMRAQEEIRKIERELSLPLRECSTEDILWVEGMRPMLEDDGKLRLYEYGQPKSGITTFNEMGLDENKFFEEIEETLADCVFTHSNATSTGALQTVGGNAIFRNSKIKDLPNLKEIKGNVYLGGCPLTKDDFKNIKTGQIYE